MIRNLNKQDLEKIVTFIKDNYEAPSYLIPQSVEELVTYHGYSEVFMIEDDYGIEALSFFKKISPNLAEKYKTVVRLDVRGIGLSKQVDEYIENILKTNGVTKIQTNVFTDNFPSIFSRLKRGYLIEGLLRNHDKLGRHEYILGKVL